MLKRLVVSRARFDSDSDSVLLEAIFNNQTAAEPLTAQERIVFDADQYLSSVMMDGHLLAFCSNGPKPVAEWAKALQPLGAAEELGFLAEALELWVGAGCPDYDAANEVLSERLDDVDQRFYTAMEAGENLETRTKRYVRENLTSFVDFEG